ncbi:MAG TPA: hypothetical protein V6C72_17415 [Chroococcales cyanobacterium]
MVQKQLNTLMQKEMTRKEFLATMGVGVASIMGFGTIVKLLSGKATTNRSSMGYGSSSYGGK